jgi:hypothetical protein
LGKNKYIESPEKMWELFKSYRETVKSKPILVQDYVGAMASKVDREKERPLTMPGFECFVMDNTDITYPDLTEYFEGKNESYKDYFPICSRITIEIRRDQIEGGMAGIYNPSITQRLNGLVDQKASDDKQDVTIRVKYDRKGNNPGGATQQPTEGTE